MFIVCDFIINLLHCVNHPASENVLSMISNFLLPYILHPTHLRSASLIDNIFANTFNLVTKLSLGIIFLSFWSLKISKYTSLYHYKHDYSHFNKALFIVEVSRLDSSNVYHNSNLNLMARLIVSTTKLALSIFSLS